MSDSAKKYTIAVIPGDGIGKEVMDKVRILRVASNPSITGIFMSIRIRSG